MKGVTLEQAINACYHPDVSVVLKTPTRGIFSVDIAGRKDNLPVGLKKFLGNEAHISAIPFSDEECAILITILVSDEDVSEEESYE